MLTNNTEACATIDPSYNPPITYIICAKRHHMRKFHDFGMSALATYVLTSSTIQASSQPLKMVVIDLETFVLVL